MYTRISVTYADRRAVTFLATMSEKRNMTEERKHASQYEYSRSERSAKKTGCRLRDIVLCYLKFAANTITKLSTNANI
jgi:hypothetical protein